MSNAHATNIVLPLEHQLSKVYRLMSTSTLLIRFNVIGLLTDQGGASTDVLFLSSVHPISKNKIAQNYFYTAPMMCAYSAVSKI